MKVLIATDGAPEDLAAIDEAARLLRLAAADVHVAAIAGLVPAELGYATRARTAAHVGQALAHAETALAAALARLEAHGLQATGHTCEGGPAEALPALAQRLAPDLLVLCAPVEGPFTPRPRADLAAIARHSWPGAILLLRPRQPRPADRV